MTADHIRKSLIEHLSKQGVSQSELARRVGLPRTVINDLLRARKPIGVAMAMRLAQGIYPDRDIDRRVWQAIFGAS